MADATELQQRLDNLRWLLAEHIRTERKARAEAARINEFILALKREAYKEGVDING